MTMKRKKGQSKKPSAKPHGVRNPERNNGKAWKKGLSPKKRT